MDRQTLIKAMGNSVISDEEAAAFNEALVRAGCTTVDRVAMFCAQIGHESVGLRHYSEIWGNTPDQLSYQGRMGNNGPGDGYRYRGSGPLQVTGKDNFRSLSQWAHSKGYVPTPTYFVDNPDELRSIGFGFLGAVWYWTVARPMNDFADRADIRGASIAVNGGTNGLQDRINRWNNCRTLGQALLPEEEINMAAVDDIKGFIKVFLGPVISDVKDIREQLTGSRDLVYVGEGDQRRIDWKASYKGWKQLGQNPDGSNKTFVDSLADARERIIKLETRLAALEGKK